MPTKQVGLGSWGVLELDVSCSHYGQDLELYGKKIDALINPSTTKKYS